MACLGHSSSGAITACHRLPSTLIAVLCTHTDRSQVNNDLQKAYNILLQATDKLACAGAENIRSTCTDEFLNAPEFCPKIVSEKRLIEMEALLMCGDFERIWMPSLAVCCRWCNGGWTDDALRSVFAVAEQIGVDP